MEVPESIEIGDGSAVRVTWADGRTDRFEAAALRAACPCAACRGSVAPSPGVRVNEVAPVGGYAVAFTFAPDSHRSGIFPYDLLRSLGDRPS